MLGGLWLLGLGSIGAGRGGAMGAGGNPMGLGVGEWVLGGVKGEIWVLRGSLWVLGGPIDGGGHPWVLRVDCIGCWGVSRCWEGSDGC